MINDKGLEIIIKQVALMNNVDPNVVDLLVTNCYNFIKTVIREGRETGEAKTILLGGYGKYVPSEKKIAIYKQLKKDRENGNSNREE